MGHLISLLVRFPISGCAYLSSQLEQRRGQKWYCPVRAMDMPAAITLGGLRIPLLGERAWLAVIIIYMMVVVAPTA